MAEVTFYCTLDPTFDIICGTDLYLRVLKNINNIVNQPAIMVLLKVKGTVTEFVLVKFSFEKPN